MLACRRAWRVLGPVEGDCSFSHVQHAITTQSSPQRSLLKALFYALRGRR